VSRGQLRAGRSDRSFAADEIRRPTHSGTFHLLPHFQIPSGASSAKGLIS
jgi:hypothetical protein